jgi:hypothetical protein
MKKLLQSLFALFITINLAAQSHESGTLSFQLGYDVGVHRTDYTSKLNGVQISQNKSTAATTIVMFGAQYNLVKFLSFGLNFGAGGYLENPENAEADGNSYRALSIDLRLYPVNKDKFNWFLGPRLGTSGLKIRRKVSQLGGQPIPTVSQESRYNSPHFGVYTGFNWYLLSFLGLNGQIGYTSHNFLMKSYSVNGTSQNLSNFDNRLKVSGVHIQFGLSVKIN